MTRNQAPAFRDYLRFAEAVVALTIAATMVALLPFRIVARTASWRGSEQSQSDEQAQAHQVVLALLRATRRLPFRLVCIQQSLAVQWMLRRRGVPSQLHYGVRSDGGDISAHVWVSLAGQILIGEADADSHACVATFPAHPA